MYGRKCTGEFSGVDVRISMQDNNKYLRVAVMI